MNISKDKDILEKIPNIDWQRVIEEMNEKRCALVSGLLPDQYCEGPISEYGTIATCSSEIYTKSSS
ncbi:MAG: hypothetical protein WBZ36_23165 [Candidatus Nitrosopolaris sp.]